MPSRHLRQPRLAMCLNLSSQLELGTSVELKVFVQAAVRPKIIIRRPSKQMRRPEACDVL